MKRHASLVVLVLAALVMIALALACGQEEKVGGPSEVKTPMAAAATSTPTTTPAPTNTPLPPKPTNTPVPPEPTDTLIPPPPSQQQEQPTAPPPAPPLPGPTTYTGTHSGGGSVSFVVSADGRWVESFQAKGFCGFDSERLGGMRMRITGGSFYWEEPFSGRMRVVSGSLDAPGHASGYVSYHSLGGCHRDNLSWSASTQ
jgi:hypothetical protein